jgi:hypothetical protein
VPVKLEIKPRSINFDRVKLGSSKEENVKVTNANGNKKNPGLTVVMEGLEGLGVWFKVNISARDRWQRAGITRSEPRLRQPTR